MGTVPRHHWTDDDGTGTTGTILAEARLQDIYDDMDSEVKSATFPSVTTKSIINNVLVNVPHEFGGTPFVGRTDTSYPVGATLDKLAPNTDVVAFDSANLPAGTYKLQATLASSLGTDSATIGLMNLTDASETTLVAVSSNSTTGAQVTTGAITFAASGAVKTYGVKLTSTNAAVRVYAWGIRIIRTG